MDLEYGSTVTSFARGFPQGQGSGSAPPARAYRAEEGVHEGGTGGSFGGVGGGSCYTTRKCDGANDVLLGNAYGVASSPWDFGSGGAPGVVHGLPTPDTAGTGGGRIKVQALSRLNVWGTVDASGSNGGVKTWTPGYSWGAVAGRGGGGSGGSVQLIGREIVGSGTVKANGGHVNNGHPGAGGGGRVALLAGAFRCPCCWLLPEIAAVPTMQPSR